YKDVLACHRTVRDTDPAKYFTDDSSVVLECGMSVAVTEGDYNNFKITTVEDILRAQACLSGLFTQKQE
ncbi:MAG: 2-C-methyl-D-erythritol 4-phosphate cytidylyltransferase, partial [Anaplasma sp.]